MIAYDRDKAGDPAAASLAEKLLSEGIACSRILFPKGMDANEYALKVKPAAQSLGVVIRSAEWLGNGARPTPRAAAQPLAAAVVVPAGAAKGNQSDDATKKERADGGEVSEVREPAPAIPGALERDEFVLTQGDRRYRVRGLKKNLQRMRTDF